MNLIYLPNDKCLIKPGIDHSEITINDFREEVVTALTQLIEVADFGVVLPEQCDSDPSESIDRYRSVVMALATLRIIVFRDREYRVANKGLTSVKDIIASYPNKTRLMEEALERSEHVAILTESGDLAPIKGVSFVQ